MKSNIKETREAGKPKEAWEMTFEEFSKKTTAYNYKSFYNGNYQEVYIGLKSNENFGVYNENLVKFDKTWLGGKNINDRERLVNNLRRNSLHVYSAIGKSYVSVDDVKKMAYKQIIQSKFSAIAQARATRLSTLQKALNV